MAIKLDSLFNNDFYLLRLNYDDIISFYNKDEQYQLYYIEDNELVILAKDLDCLLSVSEEIMGHIYQPFDIEDVNGSTKENGEQILTRLKNHNYSLTIQEPRKDLVYEESIDTDKKVGTYIKVSYVQNDKVKKLISRVLFRETIETYITFNKISYTGQFRTYHFALKEEN